MTVTFTAELSSAPRQDKPWGHELLFADGTHGYVGKLIAVDAGQSLSLQFHEAKDETISVVHGVARLEHGPTAMSLIAEVLHPGDTVHVPAGVLHRITAVTSLLLVEASTAAPGWREDVIRLEDRYGRTGTNNP
jgi:mannose-6-phosphate isomerase-like protein (cupin superfamily)